MNNQLSNALFLDLVEVFTRSEGDLKTVLAQFDDTGELHCLSGPALISGGYGIWVIHGQFYGSFSDYVADASISEDDAIIMRLKHAGSLPSLAGAKYAHGY